MKRTSFGLNQYWIAITLALLVVIGCSTSIATAQVVAALRAPKKPADSDAEKYGVWTEVKDEAGENRQQMRLRVYPKAASVPAFKHRLIPAASERVDGNSALFYLKAIGFFEQRNAREQLTKLERKWRDEATEEARDGGDYPPYTWHDAAPESLPMDEVRQYLKLLSFQPEFLYDAARRTRFEHDRAIERETNPMGYLLPSIQQHREIARIQTVRCRFAIAEGRIDDAVEVVGQMMALGRHLGTDEFLVSCLVGAAVHGIGVKNGLVLSQHPDTPNLYWAIAACPEPAIDLSRAFAMERNFLMLQFPIFKEVTEAIRPPEFWVSFLQRFTKFGNEYNQLYGEELKLEWDPFHAATVIAKDYPTARDFLHEVVGMSEQQLDQYPKAQVVFLAIVKYYELAQDEGLKQIVVPFVSRSKDDESELIKRWSSRFCPNPGQLILSKSFLPIGELFVPATRQVIEAKTRVDQQQNLWQTVEALRMTAAENGGKFPDSLDQLVVPAPLDPATNLPFKYEHDGGVAIVRAKKIGWQAYEIKLELANQDDQKKEVE